MSKQVSRMYTPITFEPYLFKLRLYIFKIHILISYKYMCNVFLIILSLLEIGFSFVRV